MRINPAISKIIAIVSFLVIIGIFIFAFASGNSSEQGDYNISYDSKAGVITITLEEALMDGQWSAYVYYETDTGDEPILKNGTVIPSADRMSFRIIDDDDELVNLDNNTYKIDLKSYSGHPTMHFQFTFNGHEFSTMEMVAIGVCITLALVIVVFAVVRRIVRGH